jgi:ribosomal protein S18 acetylase RimI-like enzyme
VAEFATVERNLRECFRALAAHRQNAEIRWLGGVELLSLGVRFQMFNAAFLASPVRNENDLDRRIAEAAVHFGARGMEWSFWLCDGFLPEEVSRHAQKIFARRGLTLATQMPGMLTTRLGAPDRALPRCEIRAVNGKATLQDFREIGSQCFRVPLDWFQEVFDTRTSVREPFRAWVGYAEGKPIATAATLLDGEAIGIYNVATIPEFRSLGYAEALMREALALEVPRAAGLPIVLQSTLQGLRLYRRMGFEAATRFRVWVS